MDGLFKMAIRLAVVLLAVGAGVVGHDVLAAPRLHASVSGLPPQFEARPTCIFVTIDLSGGCPLPPISAQAWTTRATILLCADSLCGRGFRAGDTVTILARRADGSTFWRTRADRNGNFRSPLPLPLCHFTPVGLMAFDDSGERSIRLSLAKTRCAAVKN
jgi:hypothetical protein